MILRTEENFDVIVVGSGGGGMRAAAQAASAGCRTALLSKGKLNRSGATPMAGAGICGDVDADGKSLYEMGFKDADRNIDQDRWFKDILVSGCYLADQELLRLHVEKAPEAVSELLQWGVKVSGMESSTALSIKGTDIADSLLRIIKSLGVVLYDDAIVSDVVARNGLTAGAVGVTLRDGEVRFWPAKAVILATGGMHGMYGNNTGSTCLTGDGIAMAHRCGAELMNMEMTEFCCDTVLHPGKWRRSIMPYIMTSLGAAERANSAGHDFLGRYYAGKTLDMALNTEWSKMLVSMAEYQEIKAGRGIGGGLRLKVNEGRLDETFRMFPELAHNGQIRDMLGGEFIVIPAAHYFVGGIRVDSNFQSTTPGLFACGECSAGIFGANRVASALTEMLTTGKIAGASAAKFALSSGVAHAADEAKDLARKIARPLEQPHGDHGLVFRLEKKMKDNMDENCGVVKNERSLVLAKKTLEETADEFETVSVADAGKIYSAPWIAWLNMRNMLPLCEFVIESSLYRKESRGVFARDDHFVCDNAEWLRNTVVKADGSIDSFSAQTPAWPPNFDRLPYFEAIDKLAERVG